MQREIDRRSFRDIWNDLSREEKREMIKAFVLADIVSDRHMLWKWSTGSSPRQPLIRKAVADTMNNKLGYNVTLETLFP